MVSSSSALGFTGVSAVFVGLFVVWLNQELVSEEEVTIVESPLSWDQIAKQGYPICKRPIVMRGIFKYPDNDACVGEDECIGLLKQAMIDKFGERIVEVFPPKHNSDYLQKFQHPGEWAALQAFFNAPEYENYTINTLAQLGSQEEYHELLSLGQKGNVNSFRDLTHVPNSLYLGSQFFMGRGVGTGTAMHWAFGTNLFVMLAGSKRWLLVSPEASYRSNCTIAKTGIWGQCFPGDYFQAEWGNVSIDEYKRILVEKNGIREHEIIDVTLKPGDVFINCDLWGHVVENVSPMVFAFSLRYKDRPWHRTFSRTIFRAIVDGFYQALKSKWTNPNRHTILDTMLTNSEGFLDHDPRMKMSGFKNQKTAEEAKAAKAAKAAKSGNTQ